MSVLSKAQIIAAQDLPRVEVDMPEWGGSVFVRMLPATERDALQNLILNDKGERRPYCEFMGLLRIGLCAAAMCDQDGNAIFTMGEAAELGKKNALALDRIHKAAEKLNAVTGEETETIKND